MRRTAPLPLVVAGILIVLTALFLSTGHLKHERVEELARFAGHDEQSRSIRTELEEYRIANRNQQRGILVVGFVIVLVAVAW